MEHENPATGVVAAAAKHGIGTIASPPVHVDGASKKAKRNRLETASDPTTPQAPAISDSQGSPTSTDGFPCADDLWESSCQGLHGPS